MSNCVNICSNKKNKTALLLGFGFLIISILYIIRPHDYNKELAKGYGPQQDILFDDHHGMFDELKKLILANKRQIKKINPALAAVSSTTAATTSDTTVATDTTASTTAIATPVPTSSITAVSGSDAADAAARRAAALAIKVARLVGSKTHVLAREPPPPIPVTRSPLLAFYQTGNVLPVN
jgi:hypothetical protein